VMLISAFTPATFCRISSASGKRRCRFGPQELLAEPSRQGSSNLWADAHKPWSAKNAFGAPSRGGPLLVDGRCFFSRR